MNMMVRRNNKSNSKNSGVPRKQQQQKRNPSVTGNTALSRITKFAHDQVVRGAVAVRNRYTGPNGVNQMARDLSLLKMVVNTEAKQIYTTAAAIQNVNSTTSLVYGIGTMAQGTSGSTRVGDSIKIVRIDLNVGFYYSSGTACINNNQVFNWYLVRYLKTPSTSGTSAFAIADFLNNDGNSQITPLSFPNSDLNEDFMVMGSGQVELQLPNWVAATDSTSQRVINFSHECSFHQTYSGSANTTITDNMCFVVVTAARPINTGGSSGVAIQSCMWYLDN
jgi:hypothetical protein